MADKTSISWTQGDDGSEGATWNPTTGCSKVSPGCLRCYAEALSLRRGWSKKPWTAPNAAENVILHPDRLSLPTRWKQPKRIFVDSMSDLFHEQIPDEFVAGVFDVMGWSAPWHTYMVLTKRPTRMRDMVTRIVAEKFGGMPPGNVWLGVSIEDQRRADERIPLLLETPAAIRFLSCEPLLGPLDLVHLDPIPVRLRDPLDPLVRLNALTGHVAGPDDVLDSRVDWVIAGGESGPGFRPMDLDWARSLRDACTAADVAFFFKQGSGPRPGMAPTLDGVEWHQFPTVAGQAALALGVAR